MKWARVCALLCFAFVAASLQAQNSTQSLGELARRERERRKTVSQPATQTVTSEAVGLRLTVPVGWKVTENRNSPPASSFLVIQCAPGYSSWHVGSTALPKSKNTITAESWEESTGAEEPYPRLSSRNFQVAGYPAHEALFGDSEGRRKDEVYVLARDAGRLFLFSFGFMASATPEECDGLTPTIEKVLQTFSPVGRPSAEELDFAELAAKWTPEEQRAHTSVFRTLFFEGMCKGMVGKFVTFEQMVKDCKMEIPKEEDPRRDPNFDFRLTPRGEEFELSAIPRRAGLGGFFSDGKKVYYNPQGPASSKDKALYDISLPGTTTELTPKDGAQPSQSHAATQEISHGKKVITEEDLKNLRGTVNVGGGEPSAPTASAEIPSTGEWAPAQGEYKPEEEVALQYMCTFGLLEDLECHLSLKRYCTIEELVRGIETKPGKISGFKEGNDPRLDPNYEYRLTVRGEDNIDVSAIPRKPGLGGFFDDGRHHTRYNPRGEASNNDKPVKDGLINCIGFR